MSKKANLTDIRSGYTSAATLNKNLERLNDQFENTLSLDGSAPNAMQGDLDMNSNAILNTGTIDIEKLLLNGQRVFSVESTPTWKGPWQTAVNYTYNDLVSDNGNSYISLQEHVSSNSFANDRSAGRWELFVSKGSSGSGTGDMQAANNLSDLDDIPTAVANLQLGTAATTNSDEYSARTPGLVSYFATLSAPSGWLHCNGTAISRLVYSDLFAAIGTRWGNGNGSTTFNLPDLRGEFIRGWDAGKGVDSGRTFGSWQADMFKAHTHGNASGGYIGSTGRADYLSGYKNDGRTTSTGGNETRPRNVALLTCIQY